MWTIWTVVLCVCAMSTVHAVAPTAVQVVALNTAPACKSLLKGGTALAADPGTDASGCAKAGCPAAFPFYACVTSAANANNTVAVTDTTNTCVRLSPECLSAMGGPACLAPGCVNGGTICIGSSTPDTVGVKFVDATDCIKTSTLALFCPAGADASAMPKEKTTAECEAKNMYCDGKTCLPGKTCPAGCPPPLYCHPSGECKPKCLDGSNQVFTCPSTAPVCTPSTTSTLNACAAATAGTCATGCTAFMSMCPAGGGTCMPLPRPAPVVACNTTCSAGQVCKNGACVPAAGCPAPGCTTDGDVCYNGQCMPIDQISTCTTPCLVNQTCINGNCTALTCSPPCSLPGSTCSNGRCITSCPTPSQAQITAGFQCLVLTGKLVPADKNVCANCTNHGDRCIPSGTPNCQPIPGIGGGNDSSSNASAAQPVAAAANASAANASAAQPAAAAANASAAQPAAAGGPRDIVSWCCYWAQNGQCNTNKAFMLPNCRKSCGTTPPGCTRDQAAAGSCNAGTLNTAGCPWTASSGRK